MPRRRVQLGFNARISFPDGGATHALREGIELFRVAEQLGYATGWVYQRHFDNYLASPLTFLTAVGEHTDRIGLGTAIIGVRYEDPVLLAEAAGTADLLSGGRIQLGLATGQGGYDAVFGQEPSDGHDQARRRLAGFVRGVRGEPVGEATDPAGLIAVGTPLRVRPHSPGLADRIWYGAGSVASARFTGEQGLRLLLSTILSGEVADFGAELAAAIGAYRAAHVGPGPSRAAVARSVLPATTAELTRAYAAYADERRQFGPAASRPQGALPPSAHVPRRFTMSPVHHGMPAAVLAELHADPSVALAEELICFLPPAFGLKENLRLLEDIAEMFSSSLEF
jgi:alkanesulfonate monooxygenase SsuD/methylene tetrahydromethanopterin reductase-like flavin-dependent oxidoreductase (luciferase family)